ncbi:hypothetical protein HK152_03655 [Streptococcus agalactiae]|nr:hypothetical protein [Streptococcus agalactiae]MCC9885321.1 hypothetical protein [Streptococcus agalactiae]MCC9896808.1 hypothetical protein [Streptococcus agalactiae]
MSKTIKEIADDLGVSKTAIRNKLTDEFRTKWVQTSTANGVQTLVITEDGVNALKSIFKGGNSTANLGANQPQTSLRSTVFYEDEIKELRKLLDQSQQLLLNEQKKSQLLLENKPQNDKWEIEKQRLEEIIAIKTQSSLETSQRASRYYDELKSTSKLVNVLIPVMVALFVLLLVLVWIHFF